MKTKINVFILTLFSVFVFNACDDENFAPDNKLQNTFNTMFPNAKFVEWEKEHGYYQADFVDNGLEKEVWFDSNGNWILTETDYEGKIPEIIIEAMKTTEYTDWRIDDVDYIEHYQDDPFYVVEIEKGNSEKDLFFSKDGEFIRVAEGKGDYRPQPWVK